MLCVKRRVPRFGRYYGIMVGTLHSNRCAVFEGGAFTAIKIEGEWDESIGSENNQRDFLRVAKSHACQDQRNAWSYDIVAFWCGPFHPRSQVRFFFSIIFSIIFFNFS